MRKSKIFVETRNFADDRPLVLAYYESSSDIAIDEHGHDTTMMLVPHDVITFESSEEDRVTGGISIRPGSMKLPRLAADWRNRAAADVAAAEADRRIIEVLPPLEQVGTLQELLDFVTKYGVEQASWPPDARARKAEIDALWNYVKAVRERARAMKTLPRNPTSDNNWPTRIVKHD